MPFLGHTIFFNKFRHEYHKIYKGAERCSQKPGLYCCKVHVKLAARKSHLPLDLIRLQLLVNS
uniref:Uncharacterized protein n=1 Tax=Arundo donax TaxID=35708 RepID=A0A0A9FBL7_ARUDO